MYGTYKKDIRRLKEEIRLTNKDIRYSENNIDKLCLKWNFDRDDVLSDNVPCSKDSDNYMQVRWLVIYCQGKAESIDRLRSRMRQAKHEIKSLRNKRRQSRLRKDADIRIKTYVNTYLDELRSI